MSPKHFRLLGVENSLMLKRSTNMSEDITHQDNLQQDAENNLNLSRSGGV
jgi:hypothetical protein